MERLQKIIAESGFCSRRKAEEYIKNGQVYVNGKKITELGTKASFSDAITVNGHSLEKEEKVYYLLNKPRGYISTLSDEHDRKKVTDLIKTDKRIYPVGRLDYDTTGLLLLTNNGELANILMHPSSSVPKTYVAKLNKVITPKDQMILKHGVKVDNVKCIPTKVRVRNVDVKKDTCIVEITIVEGRNHIIKNVFMNLGYLVDKLTRVEYGFLKLDNLKSGEYRELSIKEVKKLYDYKN